MSKDINKILTMMRTLLEQGRGFDFQSHGMRNGDNHFNMALYPVKWNKGKTVYMTSNNLATVVGKLQIYMVEGEVDIGEPEIEEESMEDML